MYLVNAQAAWLQPQRELTPQKLADEILKMNRTILLETAEKSKKLYIPNTVDRIVAACEELIK
jgi:UDP-N-acetylglucosamine--N-acetylmuramyl-(pentapeptide) pyrophosphoryl-undecaprenol N-acetylglucosamine transferase